MQPRTHSIEMQSQVNSMIRDSYLRETARVAGIICAIHKHKTPVRSSDVRSNQPTSRTHQKNNKYLMEAQLANGKVIKALLDTGASHSFIQREWVLRNSLATIPSPTALTFGLASSTGRIVVDSQVLTDIVTPYGRIKEQLINVADISHELLVGRDLLDPTDNMLCLELANCRLKPEQIQQLSMKVTKGLEQHALEPEEPTDRNVTRSTVGEFGVVQSGKLPMSASTDISGEGLTNSKSEEITQRIHRDYADVFQEKLPNQIPPITASTILHEIRLKDSDKEKPTRGYYPIAHKFYRSGKRVLFEHIAARRLIPSKAPVAAPMFFKGKKDPTADPRMLVDYRSRNTNTIRDATCVPKVEEILRLAIGKYYARLDLTNAFSQIRMHPDSQHLTAINTPWGCYEWTIMPQGLCNSPATWQRRINKALAGLLGEICFAYVDDIIVYGADTLEEHERRVRVVLDALRSDGLLVNPKKSDLVCKEVEILGHKISNKGIFPDYQKIDKVKKWPVAKNKKHIQQFMGLVNYLRKFIPDLAPHAIKLTRLTRKNIPFKWTEIEQEAFEKIKELTVNSLLLKPLIYDNGEPIWLITDASATGIGAVLSQGPDWKTAASVAFESRGYHGNEEKKHGEWNYPVHDKELLAIINALKKWKHLLLGAKFTICTDHESIKYLMTKQQLSD